MAADSDSDDGALQASCSFSQAFEHVLLHRAGIAVSSGKFVQEQMDEELRLASQLEGMASEAAGKERRLANGVEEGKPWSADAAELMSLVRKIGARSPNLSSEAFLRPFFRDLDFSGMWISSLDPSVAAFSRLVTLDISRCALTQIGALPPNLQILHAYSSKVSRVTCGKVASLRFLGLGHSRMDERGLEQAAKRFRNLLSLDVSFSEVTDLEKALELMKPMEGLKQLCLQGNPVCLLPHYRMRSVRLFPGLRNLDGLAVTADEVSDAKLKIAEPPVPEAEPSAGDGQPEAGDAAATEGEMPDIPAPVDGDAGPVEDAGLMSMPLAAPREEDGRPAPIRVSVQPLRLSGARSLLQCFATELAERKRSFGIEGPAEGQEEADQISEACSGGALRLKFELPGGTWVETTEIALDAEANPPKEGEAVFSSFALSALKTSDGQPLSLMVDVGKQVEGGDGLRDLHRWLREGMHLKVFCRPPLGPSDEALKAMAAEAAEAAERPPSQQKGKKPAAAPKKGAETKPEPVEEDPDAPPRELPPERPVGGVVVPLDALLQPAILPAGAEAREKGEVQHLPPPMQLEVSDARVVTMDKFLNPEVQVPIGAVVDKRRSSGCIASARFTPVAQGSEVEEVHMVTSYGFGGTDGAKLQVRVALYAGEVEEAPVEAEPVEDPKAKKKGKK